VTTSTTRTNKPKNSLQKEVVYSEPPTTTHKQKTKQQSTPSRKQQKRTNNNKPQPKTPNLQETETNQKPNPLAT